jgi:heat shock protein HslJ
MTTIRMPKAWVSRPAVLLLALVLLVVAAGAYTFIQYRDTTPWQQVDLVGSTWALVSVNDSPVPAGVQETISFGADGKVTVQSPCEVFAARWGSDNSGDMLGIYDIPPLTAACLPDAKAYDRDLRRTLDGVRYWRVDDADRIRFEGADHVHLIRVDIPTTSI